MKYEKSMLDDHGDSDVVQLTRVMLYIVLVISSYTLLVIYPCLLAKHLSTLPSASLILNGS